MSVSFNLKSNSKRWVDIILKQSLILGIDGGLGMQQFPAQRFMVHVFQISFHIWSMKSSLKIPDMISSGMIKF